MMTDPIGDMFTRIRNAARVGHQSVKVPFSMFKLSLAKILAEQGAVTAVQDIKEEGAPRHIVITLRYRPSGATMITDIQRVSRPGARIFVDKDHIAAMKQNFGFLIVSTTEGVMTGYEAQKRQMGGEVIGKVIIAG